MTSTTRPAASMRAFNNSMRSGLVLMTATTGSLATLPRRALFQELCRKRGEELRDRLSGHGIDPVGGDLGERFEDEPPLAEPRVRHSEPLGMNDGTADRKSVV